MICAICGDEVDLKWEPKILHGVPISEIDVTTTCVAVNPLTEKMQVTHNVCAARNDWKVLA